MGTYWKYEGIRFTWFARWSQTPDDTGGVEVDFAEVPETVSAAIFYALNLPLRQGMTQDEVRALLGEPEETHVFVADRTTCDYVVGTHQLYRVGCTVHNTTGLIHVSVIRKDVLAQIEAT